jgi:hypothetical protein
MARTHSRSLAAGGINLDSLPMKLFAGGNAKFWDPTDIDFSRDRADWALQNTDDTFAPYDEMPFGLTAGEVQQYAADKGMRRFGTIRSAGAGRSKTSMSTTRPCSWMTHSPTKTKRPSRLRRNHRATA